MSRKIENDGPKPKAPTLTPRQLLAARMFVARMRSAEVAVEIGTTRRTVNRWKQTIPFQVEVRRLHELVALQYAAHKQAMRSYYKPALQGRVDR